MSPFLPAGKADLVSRRLEQIALSCAREVRASDCRYKKNYRVSHSSSLFARLRHLLPTRQNPAHLFETCSSV